MSFHWSRGEHYNLKLQAEADLDITQNSDGSYDIKRENAASWVGIYLERPYDPRRNYKITWLEDDSVPRAENYFLVGLVPKSNRSANWNSHKMSIYQRRDDSIRTSHLANNNLVNHGTVASFGSAPLKYELNYYGTVPNPVSETEPAVELYINDNFVWHDVYQDDDLSENYFLKISLFDQGSIKNLTITEMDKSTAPPLFVVYGWQSNSATFYEEGTYGFPDIVDGEVGRVFSWNDSSGDFEMVDWNTGNQILWNDADTGGINADDGISQALFHAIWLARITGRDVYYCNPAIDGCVLDDYTGHNGSFDASSGTAVFNNTATELSDIQTWIDANRTDMEFLGAFFHGGETPALDHQNGNTFAQGSIEIGLDDWWTMIKANITLTPIMGMQVSHLHRGTVANDTARGTINTELSDWATANADGEVFTNINIADDLILGIQHLNPKSMEVLAMEKIIESLRGSSIEYGLIQDPDFSVNGSGGIDLSWTKTDANSTEYIYFTDENPFNNRSSHLQIKSVGMTQSNTYSLNALEIIQDWNWSGWVVIQSIDSDHNIRNFPLFVCKRIDYTANLTGCQLETCESRPQGIYAVNSGVDSWVNGVYSDEAVNSGSFCFYMDINSGPSMVGWRENDGLGGGGDDDSVSFVHTRKAGYCGRNTQPLNILWVDNGSVNAANPSTSTIQDDQTLGDGSGIPDLLDLPTYGYGMIRVGYDATTGNAFIDRNENYSGWTRIYEEAYTPDFTNGITPRWLAAHRNVNLNRCWIVAENGIV